MMDLFQRALSNIARLGLCCLALSCAIAHARLAPLPSQASVAEQVNRKMVKLFGAGIGSIHAYGTGVLVSADGYILTAAGPLLDTSDVLVHLYDGRRYKARVLVAEPALDAALLKIDKAEELPYFDIAAAAKKKLAQPGDWILGFSNEFKIATHEEPVSVQHGVIASYGLLRGRRGIFEAPYSGEVYVLDAISNNPGAAGGAVTDRRGELLGMIGKELRNTLSDTWINYAVPVQSLADFVEKAKRGTYKVVVKSKSTAGPTVYQYGIVLVPNVVERTPPYVEDTVPQSPAARAGLKPDDLIAYVDGVKVGSIKELIDLIARSRPGKPIRLEIRRGDRLIGVDLKLDFADASRTSPEKN